jgi:CMP-N-acetylneuraminic acid synthetase
MTAVQKDADEILVLIPAKGGSTRLPRKNIRLLGGRPLIAWAIESARNSAVSSRIVVSTDDEEIAAVARDCGAEVPFLRPGELSRDPAGVVDVALHALDWHERHGQSFRILIILLPTCPFRSADDIRGALALFRSAKAQFLMSVSKFDHTPFAAMRLDNASLLTPFFEQYAGRKSQELPTAYRPNGAIHVLDVEAFRRTRSYFSQPLVGFEMPWERSIDIDNASDLRLAESLLPAPEATKAW